MDTRTRRPNNDPYATEIFCDSKAMELPIAKERWIHKYAIRILNRYRQWESPLGVASTYLTRIKEDLVVFYDDPLKRMFIEASY